MELSAGIPASIRAPSPPLRAAVVVPARDEEARIGACLDSLAEQDGLRSEEYEVIVVLDACGDGTEAEVAAAGGRWPEMRLRSIAGPGRGAGPARAAGMDAACALLEAAGARRGLIASTDADTLVATDWLHRQLEAIGAGAEAIGGEIVLDPDEVTALPAEVLERRSLEIAERVRRAALRGPAEHAHFSGASLGITPSAYRRVGGIGHLAALEDQELEDRLAAAGVTIHRPRSVRVTTAARTDGRAERGLARDLELGSWLARRRYRATDFRLDDLLAAKRGEIVAILPARECAATIGATVAALLPLREVGLLDRLFVVNTESADRTGEIAAAAGAEVLPESSLCAELGPCRGKGDAMWRAATEVEAEILVFLDADSHDFRGDFLLGLLGPLLLGAGVELVKGTFERPLSLGASVRDGEGGRVTELVARPLLNLHFPALTGFAQPLAGEVAIRRDLFARMAVPVGYGVEIAMMIDALRLVGLEALAEVDLGTRQNSHQSLRALSLMAAEVMVAVERRTGAPPLLDSPSFRPRPEAANAELWRLRCEERRPLQGRGFAPMRAGQDRSGLAR
ncbi:MAG TPA: glucosyl-3-phosphoglycerate synthase [Solirubrobacterales bacterium]|jgi:glycosyltransferase involved in cell wall biosynthesis|nr:glucosyl-3-phosphoglycerate synthase [Solirubrobacterales bacterium]